MIFERRQQPRAVLKHDAPYCKIVQVPWQESSGKHNTLYLAYQPGTNKSAIGLDLLEAWLKFINIYGAGN